jgi:hypothetical protein
MKIVRVSAGCFAHLWSVTDSTPENFSNPEFTTNVGIWRNGGRPPPMRTKRRRILILIQPRVQTKALERAMKTRLAINKERNQHTAGYV